ncbi:ribosomal protein L7/L12 [Streptomyces sp. NPDC001941]|uniref:ribosomal protein L7/L12 n=1 Tax=Streptomyces sp. NPDC001941 TaxID=3154659 RepID=UPI00332D88B7
MAGEEHGTYLLVCDDVPHTVVLDDAGPRPLDVIKFLRRHTGASLWHCKCPISDLPTSILTNVPEETATVLAAALRAVGARAHAAARQ